jgi:transposase
MRMAEGLDLLGASLEAFRREERSESQQQEGDGRAGAKRFSPIDRSQMMMRPVCVDKVVGEDHPVRAIWAMISQLDMSRFEESVKVVEGGRGRSSSDPRLLAAMWIYAYSEGMNSAREIARMCAYEPGLQWLTGMKEINQHTLSDFRGTDKEAVEGLFVQVLGVLSAEGLTDLKRVMQDGTKVKAQASRKSFRREESLREHLRLAREQVQAMGDPNSEELSQQSIKARQRAIEERKQRLEQALQELAELEKSRKESEKGRRVSESDPEARVMMQSDGGFAPSYNVQISTEASNKIIVAVGVTQEGTDYNQLADGVDRVKANTAATPEQIVVDGGYIKNENIEKLAAQGVDLIGPIPEMDPEASLRQRGIRPAFYPDKFRYDEVANTLTCPAQKTLPLRSTDQREGRIEYRYRAEAADCARCCFRNQCCPKTSSRLVLRTEHSETVKAFRAKMQTDQAKEIYRKRAEVAEFPNAWIKEKMGLRQFRLTGLRKVSLEAVWACLTYNIQQWIRIRWRPKFAAAA